MSDLITRLREHNLIGRLNGWNMTARHLMDESRAELKRLSALWIAETRENERLRAALESLTKDPPPTLSREPDTDCEVVLKMRAIARDALSHPNQTEPK